MSARRLGQYEGEGEAVEPLAEAPDHTVPVGDVEDGAYVVSSGHVMRRIAGDHTGVRLDHLHLADGGVLTAPSARVLPLFGDGPRTLIDCPRALPVWDARCGTLLHWSPSEEAWVSGGLSVSASTRQDWWPVAPPTHSEAAGAAQDADADTEPQNLPSWLSRALRDTGGDVEPDHDLPWRAEMRFIAERLTALSLTMCRENRDAVAGPLARMAGEIHLLADEMGRR